MPRRRERDRAAFTAVSSDAAELVHAAFVPVVHEEKPAEAAVSPVESSKPKDNPDFALEAAKRRKNG
jgi:hypothetical protein